MKNMIALAVLQLGVILGWAGYHEHVRAHAATFRIPLQPVDPHDILRGRYFVLNPLDGRLKTGRPDTHLTAAAVERFMGGERYYGGTALVGFCPVGDLYRVCDLRRPDEDTPASDGHFWSRAQATVNWEATTWDATNKEVPERGWRVSLDLGLEQFFLPNRVTLPAGECDPGWELEVSHRSRQLPLPRRLWFRGQVVPTGG